jgi:hypothetical protein
MPTRNVNLTDELDPSMTRRRYENATMKLALLRTAIDAGDASGIAKGDVFARIRRTLKLPATKR